MPIFLIKQAAGLLGVSTDTLRRWADRGRVETTTDGSERLAVDGVSLAALAEQLAESADREPGGPVVAQSMRNRFTGLAVNGILVPAIAAAVLPLALLAVAPRGRLGRGAGAVLVVAYAVWVTVVLRG